MGVTGSPLNLFLVAKLVPFPLINYSYAKTRLRTPHLKLHTTDIVCSSASGQLSQYFHPQGNVDLKCSPEMVELLNVLWEIFTISTDIVIYFARQDMPG